MSFRIPNSGLRFRLNASRTLDNFWRVCYFQDSYYDYLNGINTEKAEELYHRSRREKDALRLNHTMDDKKPLSIYIHIPFCKKRCWYCDFNTFVGLDYLFEDYVLSVIEELTFFSTMFCSTHDVLTVYFGGGTPTIMPVLCYRKILNAISNNFSIAEVVEISSEGNPSKLNLDYLSELNDAGINRLSIGLQSAIRKELKILGRDQNSKEVAQAVENAKNAGFSNISLDLLYGIPTQSLEAFELSVKFAVSHQPKHLSIYGLSLEPSTPLTQKIQKGLISNVDEDLAGDMYAWVIDWMPTMDFAQYEISNWTLEENDSDFRCLHNLQYWRNLDYLGIGAGAHSHIGNRRWSNVLRIQDYIRLINRKKSSSEFVHDAIAEYKQLNREDIIKETMMMGLRLTEEGINTEQFAKRFSFEIEDIYFDQIKKLTALGLLEYVISDKSKYLRLTKKGRMIGNQVFLEFI